MDIEEKLLRYRAKKRREEFIKGTNEKIKSFFSLPFRRKMTDKVIPINDFEKVEPRQESDESGDEVACCDDDADDSLMGRCAPIRIITYILYAVLWGTLYAIFIKLEFGLVYLVTSALIGMYLNTRTRPKQKDEVSAYSVFNKDCKSIDGTLNADQFDKEIRGGGRAFVI